MAIETTTSVDVKTLTPFKRFIMTLGILPTSYLESMTYAELVMWFCNFLQNEVIPAVNNNAEAVQEIQNWINTLDLQDEVDNKLDEMAESGELAEIISQYLNSTAIFGFDTVADMKDATNLIDGSYAKTLGYHSKNDGGSALYKIRNITNDDTIDEMFIIEMNDEQNQLVAELIHNPNEANAKQLGAKGDGTTDDTTLFTNALSKVNTLIIPNARYVINNLHVASGKIIKGIENATFVHTSDSNPCLVLDTEAYTGATIENITIVGGTFDIYAIRCAEPQSKFINVKILDYIGNGIDLYTNNTFAPWQTLISKCKLTGAYDNSPENHLSDATERIGINIDMTGGHIVIEESVVSVYTTGINIVNCDNCLITGTNISECNHAFFPNSPSVPGGLLMKNTNGKSVTLAGCYLENSQGFLLDGTNDTTIIEHCYINLLAQSSNGFVLTSGSNFILQNSYFHSAYSGAKGVSATVNFNGASIINTTMDVPTIKDGGFVKVVNSPTENGVNDYGREIISNTRDYIQYYYVSGTTTYDITKGGVYSNYGNPFATSVTLNVTLSHVGEKCKIFKEIGFTNEMYVVVNSTTFKSIQGTLADI